MKTQRKPLSIRGYKLIKKIGSGASADVFEATKDGKDFALKVFKTPEESVNSIESELNFSAQVPEKITA